MKKIILYIIAVTLIMSCAAVRYKRYKRVMPMPAAKYTDDINEMRSDTLAIAPIE